MFTAYFDENRRIAALTGACQYDTGRRLRLCGMPDEAGLAAILGRGEHVTVQVQYAHPGDAQTEARLAQWNEAAGCWEAAVPDLYLQRAEPVQVYVYAGATGEGDELPTRTLYEAIFTPKARPAPGTQVTPGQKNAWDELAGEVNLALAQTHSAASAAHAAAGRAGEEAQRLAGMTVEAETAEADAQAGAVLTCTDGAYRLRLQIPRGAPGERGETGPKGERGEAGHSDVTFALEGSVLTITTRS